MTTSLFYNETESNRHQTSGCSLFCSPAVPSRVRREREIVGLCHNARRYADEIEILKGANVRISCLPVTLAEGNGAESIMARAMPTEAGLDDGHDV